MHTLSDDKKDGYEIGILSLYPHRPEKEHSLAGIPLVRVPKPRFSSKYSGQLRSPQELKIIGGPRGMLRNQDFLSRGLPHQQAANEESTFRGHYPRHTSSNAVWLKVLGYAPLSQKIKNVFGTPQSCVLTHSL